MKRSTKPRKPRKKLLPIRSALIAGEKNIVSKPDAVLIVERIRLNNVAIKGLTTDLHSIETSAREPERASENW